MHEQRVRHGEHHRPDEEPCPEGEPDRGVGVFFRFGAADKDTSPVQYAYNVGIGAKGIVPGRPSDQFGVGWSRVDLSGNLVPFLCQRLGLGLQQEDTVELYYDAAITPWLGTSLDLQITNSALEKALAPSGPPPACATSTRP